MKLTDDVKQRKQNSLNNDVLQFKNSLQNKENVARFLHRGKPIIIATCSNNFEGKPRPIVP